MQLEHEILQNQIIEEFYKQFKDYSGGYGLSAPLIPRISPAYLKTRTIVVGQETNRWYLETEINDNLHHIFKTQSNKLEEVCLEKRYDKFIQDHAAKYRGNFWKFSKMLYKKNVLHGNMIKDKYLSHCWLNVFLVEAVQEKNKRKGRPTCNKSLAENVITLQGNLLYRIFEILKPETIIFLTGHSLDRYIQQTAFNGQRVSKSSLDEKNIFETHQLARFKVEDELFGNTNIVRAYHPSYFMGRINSKRNKNLRRRFDQQNLNIKSSTHYMNVLLDSLKHKA